MTGLVWFAFLCSAWGYWVPMLNALDGRVSLRKRKRERGGAHTRGTLYPSLFVRDVYLPPHPDPCLLHPYEPHVSHFSHMLLAPGRVT